MTPTNEVFENVDPATLADEDAHSTVDIVDEPERVTRPDVLPGEPVPEPQPEPEVMSITLALPLEVDGHNIKDANGQVIAICGFAHNRMHSGPSIAHTLASKFRR